ncbi:MAG TPA: hypothetical protein VD997_11715 [Phycisphaerales bacterium]|nr:hypothetical protein [Phycisphaerales bacterium]
MQQRRGFTLVEGGFAAAAVSLLVCLGLVPMQPEPSKQDKPAARPEQDGKQERPRRYKPGQPEKTDEPRETGENGALLVAPTVSALSKARASARQIKCATMVRGISQGLIMFAQGNEDSYPRPSRLDKENTTINAAAHEKDTTDNIISVMIYNGFFGPELCVTPAEVNKNIKMMKDYAYASPASAATPQQALWDPAFNADFTSPDGGHLSYAHLMPSRSRRHIWTNSFSSTEAAVGNRGPRIEALERRAERDVPVLPEKSHTYRIHGANSTWEGNVAFNDNHVEFMTTMYAPGAEYLDPERVKKPDNFFYDENDDPADSNLVLGIYTRAGITTDHFKGIWD